MFVLAVTQTATVNWGKYRENTERIKKKTEYRSKREKLQLSFLSMEEEKSGRSTYKKLVRRRAASILGRQAAYVAYPSFADGFHSGGLYPFLQKPCFYHKHKGKAPCCGPQVLKESPAASTLLRGTLCMRCIIAETGLHENGLSDS
jgi:hypothetical protein